MAYKNDDWCIKKAFNDEKLFVLMARDITSPQIVGEWIKQNIGIQPRERLIEALDCALEMFASCQEMRNRKNLQKEDWIFVQSELPAYESCCDVLYSNFTTGVENYFDIFSRSKETENLEVIAWKNPRRAV